MKLVLQHPRKITRGEWRPVVIDSVISEIEGIASGVLKGTVGAAQARFLFRKQNAITSLAQNLGSNQPRYSATNNDSIKLLMHDLPLYMSYL